MQQPTPLQPPQDLASLAHRVTSIEFHVENAEKELERLGGQLANYVPTNVNDMQLSSIRSTVERIEGDVKEARKEIVALSTQVGVQSKEHDQLQIRVLKWAVGIFVGIVVAVVTGFLIYLVTHPGG